MDLDPRQTRDFFLAGTVAFPTPFLTTGTISFTKGPKGNDSVIIEEYHHPKTVIRLMLQRDVSAIFIPGVRDSKGTFQISQEQCVHDLEQGEWFVDDDVKLNEILKRLKPKGKADAGAYDPTLRGIVFVAEDRPILVIKTFPHTAGADEELLACCTRDYVKGCCTRDYVIACCAFTR